MIKKHSPLVSGLTAALLIWTLAAPLARSAEEDPAILQAQALVTAGKSAEALALLDGVIAAGQGDPERARIVAEAHYLKAKIYFAARETDQVEKELTWVYVLFPEFEREEDDVEFRIYMKSMQNRVYSRSEAAHVERPARDQRAAHFKTKKRLPLLALLGGAVLAGGLAYLVIRLNKSDTVPEGNGLISLLESVPSGITASVDNVVVGTTPVGNLTVKAGFRTIKLYDGTFGAAYRSLTVQKDRTYRLKGTISPFGFRLWSFWGGRGTGNGEFLSPQGCAVSGSSCYVCDSDETAGRVQKLTLTGTYLAQWKTKSPSPVAIAADGGGRLYVTTSGGIEKYSSSGALLAAFAGDLRQARGIAVSPTGSFLIVAEAAAIRKYSLDGVLLKSWSHGYGAGARPCSLAFDAGGNIYASVAAGSAGSPVRIHKFNANGDFLLSWEIQGSSSRSGIRLYPLAVDGRNNLVFGDSGSQQVISSRPDGSFQGRIMDSLAHPLPLNGLALDGAGYLYITASSGADARIIRSYPQTEPADSGSWEVQETAGFTEKSGAPLRADGRRPPGVAAGGKGEKR